MILLTDQKTVGSNNQSSLPLVAAGKDDELWAKDSRSCFQVLHLVLRIGIALIGECPDYGGLGDELVQEFQILVPSMVNMGAMPVTFPVGRLMLDTRPAPIGSLPLRKTIGIV